MRSFSALFFLPAVLACANTQTNACAKYVNDNKATLSNFCATFTASSTLPSWASSCGSSAKQIVKECACAFPGGGSVTTTLVTSTTSSAATSAPTAPGTPPSNSCGAAAVDGLVGYAAGTTGGGSGSGTTVTSCSALTAAAKSGGVIKVSGVLSGCGIVDLVSDTSVIGVGAKSGLTDGGFRIQAQKNVILRNLYLKNPPPSKDLVEIKTSSTYVWVDHCDFSAEGITGDKDYYDGMLDITHGSDFITASWNVFHDHWKASLIGHSDSNSAEDSGHLRVTYHHNHWYNVNSRLPSLRFGTGHFYSSCFENNPTSGINVRMGAKALAEQNYFLNTKLAIATNLDTDADGFATDLNNVFVGSTKSITQTASYTPPYSYTLDPASCVCDLVKKSAGTGVVG
ncbi:unnamed protein product [Discula destructiva]